MKNRIFTCGIAMMLGFMCCSYSTKSEVQLLQRGVNLSHWFSQTRLSDFPPLAATAEDMKLIRSLGLDHIRLPVDPVRLWEFPGDGPLNADTLQQMDDAIRLALDHGLNVVVDMHPRPDFKGKLENDPEFFNSFLKFWTVLAAHLTQYDTGRLALEILNEPIVEDPLKWQAMAGELHGAIRKAAPKHTIIIGGGEWSNVAALRRLVPPADPNLVYTFHFYDPHLFTHQGAKWGSPEWVLLKGIPYPLSAQRGAEILEGVSDESAREALQEHIAEQWDAEKINGQISGVASWAQEHGVTIWCGEFGVYRPYANSVDRARYLRDVRATLDRHGIGWALWDYQGSFSLVEKEEPGAPAKVDRPIAEALGLFIPGGGSK